MESNIRRRDRRYQVVLPLIKDIRLTLWGHTRGVSKTRMSEAILIDRVSNKDNWNEVCKDLQQEAALNNTTVPELIKSILKSGNYEGVDIDNVDWSFLVDSKLEEPTIDEVDEV